MHIDWTCSLFIVVPSNDPQNIQLLCFKDTKDMTSPGNWRLPGGSRLPNDTDVMQTLVTHVRGQTGFDFSRRTLELLDQFTEVERLPQSEISKSQRRLRPRTKKLTKTTRYYEVIVDMDEFFDRKRHVLDDHREMRFMPIREVLARKDFYWAHRTVVLHYASDADLRKHVS